jgi:preprotein translocase subunit SecY
MSKATFSKISSVFKRPLFGIKNIFKKLIPSKLSRPGSNSLISALKTKEVQRKIFFTLSIILVYRILAAVPLPGIDIKIFNQVFGSNPATNIFTLVTGGRLDDPSVVAIGLGAYINASVIIQLLSAVIPHFEELSKEGERGRRILNTYTRILAVPLNIIQAFVIYTIVKNVGQTIPELAGILADVTTLDVIAMISALTAGSMVLMWLGELITEKGIGNGTSIIIMTSILSVVPRIFTQDLSFVQEDINLLLKGGNLNILVNEKFLSVYLVIFGLLALIVGIVYVTEAVRKLTIQYASRVRASQSGQKSYLPLKLNQAGVMPVIFAYSLLTFPQILSQLLMNLADQTSFLYKLGNTINTSFLTPKGGGSPIQDTILYEGLLFLLIVFFTFFYTFVTFKPSETADNLKKSGGFIPGLRPGKETERFIKTVLIRLSFWGAIFLATVAIIPNLYRLGTFTQNLNLFSTIGGTSLLIIVGVIADTLRQVKSVAVTRSYEQFK